jgi:tRNA-2-methylthio-N6-dimethylallyladenosine synthase
MDGFVQIRRAVSQNTAPEPAPEGPVRASMTTSEAARVVYVETYGCQMNVADTEMALGLLGGAGYRRTDDPERADVILINTCAVREKAEERVFGRVGALARHRERPGVVLGVTGCMAEHLKEKLLARAPAVDLIVGPDGYRRLVDHVEDARSGRRVQDTVLDRHETYEGLDPSREMTGGVTGHITIQRGCDKFCTFCVVPYTRGRERGIPPREILRQAHAMAAAGYKEIQLLGQTVNSYRYEDATFADVLRAVGAIDGIERVRFTSPYPLDFSPDVMAAMAASPKICKHVHLPLQSGSDAVLARMRRGYDFATFRRLAAELRAAMPGIAITTDILVGFCDETDAEHAATLAAMEEIRFDNAFTFAYSEREGTVAARRIPDTVPAEIKQRRLAEVIALQRRITSTALAAQVGRTERILLESRSRRSADDFLGRTDTFRSVIVPSPPNGLLDLGALVDVEIVETTSATLIGRLV